MAATWLLIVRRYVLIIAFDKFVLPLPYFCRSNLVARQICEERQYLWGEHIFFASICCRSYARFYICHIQLVQSLKGHGWSTLFLPMEVLLKKLRVFFLGKSSTCSLFFSPVQSVYLIFAYHVPRFVSLWTDKRSSLSLVWCLCYTHFAVAPQNLAIGGGRCVSVDILISLMVGIVASLIAAFIYDRIR